jgi:hypothetical protein
MVVIPAHTLEKLDPDTRMRELESLQKLLSEPITAAVLTRWVSGSASRAGLLDHLVWGSIRWSRDLGLPQAPTHAAAFTILHEYHQLVFEVGPGGEIIDKSTWVPLPTPSTWDGPDDDEYYRVSFQTPWAVSPWENRLYVRLADHVPWERVIPRVERSFKLIEPLGVYFGLMGQRFTVLPEFEVVEQIVPLLEP